MLNDCNTFHHCFSTYLLKIDLIYFYFVGVLYCKSPCVFDLKLSFQSDVSKGLAFLTSGAGIISKVVRSERKLKCTYNFNVDQVDVYVQSVYEN